MVMRTKSLTAIGSPMKHLVIGSTVPNSNVGVFQKFLNIKFGLLQFDHILIRNVIRDDLSNANPENCKVWITFPSSISS